MKTKQQKPKLQYQHQEEPEFDAYIRYSEYCTEYVSEQDEKDTLDSLYYAPSNNPFKYYD